MTRRRTPDQEARLEARRSALMGAWLDAPDEAAAARAEKRLADFNAMAHRDDVQRARS